MSRISSRTIKRVILPLGALSAYGGVRGYHEAGRRFDMDYGKPKTPQKLKKRRTAQRWGAAKGAVYTPFILWTLFGPRSEPGSHRKEYEWQSQDFRKSHYTSRDVDSLLKTLGTTRSNVHSKKDLSKAYKIMARRYHPDLGGDPLHMQKVNAAMDDVKSSSWYSLLKEAYFKKIALKIPKGRSGKSILRSLINIRRKVKYVDFSRTGLPTGASATTVLGVTSDSRRALGIFLNQNFKHKFAVDRAFKQWTIKHELTHARQFIRDKKISTSVSAPDRFVREVGAYRAGSKYPLPKAMYYAFKSTSARAAFFKKAGILSEPQTTLAPGIWTEDQRLECLVRKQILTAARDALPDNVAIMSISIIGSITGFKYTSTSDVDINLHIEPFDESMGKTHFVKDINGFLAQGTSHPVNFFLQAYNPKSSWQGSKYGVYDVIRDAWVIPPSERETIRDPKKQFPGEISLAKQVARAFSLLIEEFHKDLRKLKQIKCAGIYTWSQKMAYRRKVQEVNNDFSRLIEMAKGIDKQRKFVYNRGWGVPRESSANIVFKYISKGPYGKFFEKIESLNINAKIAF